MIRGLPSKLLQLLDVYHPVIKRTVSTTCTVLLRQKICQHSSTSCAQKSVLPHSIATPKALSTSAWFNSSDEHQFPTKSPYKTGYKPTRVGYEQKIYDGGLLPRLNEDVYTKKHYNPRDRWNRQRALFGQNDYIDILGDGKIQPYQLMEGPTWLRGFKGIEYQRILRRLRLHGRQIKAAQPKLYDDLNKRLRFLYKKYNVGRSSKDRISKKI